MECRVCFSSDPPFLTDRCQCRGSQGAIHTSCLRAWIRSGSPTATPTCSVCNTAWRLPWTLPVLLPRAWHILGSPYTVIVHWFSYILLFQLLPLFTYMKVALWIQRIFFALHVWSFAPVGAYWLRRRAYWRQWCRFYLITPDQFLIPLSPVIAALLSVWIPSLLILVYPYTHIWRFHKMFVALAEAEEAQEADVEERDRM